MIRVLPGRYQIWLNNGTTSVVEATQEQIDSLYKNLVNRRILKSFSGYGWITPIDYSRFPITANISTFL